MSKMTRTTSEFQVPETPRGKVSKRIKPNSVPASSSSTSPTYDLVSPNGGLMGLPQIHADGSVRLTPLPKIKVARNRQFDQVVKQGLERPDLLREATQEEATDEGDSIVADSNGDLTMETTDTEEEVCPPTDVPKKKAKASAKKPTRKKRKIEKSETEEETDEPEAEEDQFPEGFPGLKGWKAIGGVGDLMRKFTAGEIKDKAWVQYTRATSTFIPATRYKKLEEEAKHRGVELADLVAGEKEAMSSKGRKKVLCSAAMGVGEQEGSLVLSTIPPKGGRSSNFYPYQQRTWLLNEETDGGIIMYLKAF
jgi:hypothetical protein